MEGACPATDRPMHGAQPKHTFFAGVPKWIGHMSMRDQSALLTVAFSLSAASRCLQEQETDGTRGDPPAGGRGSCTIRTCCARLGACAPLSDPPRLRVSKIRTLMGARLPLAGAVRRGRWTDEGAASAVTAVSFSENGSAASCERAGGGERLVLGFITPLDSRKIVLDF